MKKLFGLLLSLFVCVLDSFGACPMQTASTLTLSAGTNYTISSVIDRTRGFAYLVTDTSPSRIVKIRLSDFTEVGSIVGEDFPFWPAAIDEAAGFAYFGLGSIPAKVVKVNLTTFTKVGVLTLNSGENYVTSMAIDPAGGGLYVGTGEYPGRVVKINLGTFTRVGAITLATGEDRLQTAVMDASRGYVYFGTGSTPGRVVRIRLSDFTKQGVLALNSDESFLQPSGVIDTAAGFAYFPAIHPTQYTTKIVKVNLVSFTRVGSISPSLTYDPNGYLNAGVIDPSRGFAYFGSKNGDAGASVVIQVDLSNFTESGKLNFDVDNNAFHTAMVDPASGFAYFPTYRYPGKVHKIAIGNCGAQIVHPADTDSNNMMALNEATKYGACWKNSAFAADCPTGIAIDYAVRGGTLWAATGTGQYTYNSAKTCPLCWEPAP